MKQENFTLSGNIVDVLNRRIFKGTVHVTNGVITQIEESENDSDQYILPGFVDSHIHVESSMLIPSEFARLACVHGTVATVSDPHEIANVLGVDGVRFMIQNGKKVPFKFFFGAPSCVHATPYESSGALFEEAETEEMLAMPDVHYLAEMMNFPAVLQDDPGVLARLALAKKYNKPVDGHAPGLTGKDAAKYAAAGISTDHECFTMQEAMDKIANGMKIQIREGSAAKNFDDLAELLNTHPDHVMLCSDDRHPNDLMRGHMNDVAARAVSQGYDAMNVIRALTFIPVMHYGLPVGLLQQGEPADIAVVNNLSEFKVSATYINGFKVSENGKSLIERVEEESPNIFRANKITKDDIALPAESNIIRVIGAIDGQLITKNETRAARIENGFVVSDTESDVLKMIVINRYKEAKPAIAFISGFGFKHGAIASTVAHDSHNLVCVGATDEDMVRAVNLLVDSRGGIALINGEEEHVLPLPVAGLMSADDAHHVAMLYESIGAKTKELGSQMHAPFMTLSFMTLLVIPELKLSDQGLFDGNSFRFTSNFSDQP
ncbi:MAG: adenine deaminase [Bacteroidota bacterium]